MKLDNYRQQVREAIQRRSGEILLNGNVDHASVIAQEAFNNAKDHVRILSSKLDASCYAVPALLNSAKVFLADPDHKLDILIEASLWDLNSNFNWKRHPLIETITEFKDQVSVKLVPKEWAAKYTFNFLILDDYGYRFEEDRGRTAAVVAFLPENDEKHTVKNLSGIFELLSANSQSLDVN